MNLTTFEHLLSAEGQSALADAMSLRPNDAAFLATFEKLRKKFPPELAKAAVETAVLRGKAASKFPHADRMCFTREALEQSSSAVVADYRAARYRQYQHVADLCCGIGADALALAAAGCRVTAVDRDPLRARMTEANLAACGFAERARVVVADVLADPLPDANAIFCDPSRRADGRRFLGVRDYLPSPPDILTRLPRDVPIAFKLAPGVPLEDLEPFDGEAEFISLHGELKECVVWLGPLGKPGRRATVLPSGDTYAADATAAAPAGGPPLRYVYDPDPALTRSGLVWNWADTQALRSLDERIAVLTSDELLQTSFATPYAVEETLPFHAKKLGEWLRSHHVGRVTPVKRGSPVDTDDLVRRWKLRGDEHRAVILTACEGKPVAVIGRRVTAATDGGRRPS